MTRSLFVLLSLLLLIVPLSAKEYVPKYDSTGRLVPATENGFEFVQGNRIYPPIDTAAFERAAISALKSRDYAIRERSEGCITYSLIRRDYDLTMRLRYNENEYWYEYVDSRNLDADPERNRIHKSYYRWIENLEKSINKEYMP
ncbi:MAG: hypothetical protein IJ831_09690 [Spirochaetales bacterium]|nr:hypothetical protein [Spirochaetales bacterium]